MPRCMPACTVVSCFSDVSMTIIDVITDMNEPGSMCVMMPGRVATKITAASEHAATSCTSEVDSAFVEATLRLRRRFSSATASKRVRLVTLAAVDLDLALAETTSSTMPVTEPIERWMRWLMRR